MLNKKKLWLKSVNDDIHEIISQLQILDEETIRNNPEPEQWSIIQIATHINESIPFWLKHIESVIKNPSTKWGEGRSYFDLDRLYAISDKNISNLTVNEVIIKLKETLSSIEKYLRSLTIDEFKIIASSDSLSFNNKTVKYIFKKEIINHIKGHVYQIKRNLVKLDKVI